MPKQLPKKKYYISKNITFVTSDDINREYEMVRYNKSLGLPARYEVEHKQHYTFTNGVKKIYNGLRRRLNTKINSNANNNPTNVPKDPSKNKPGIDAELEAAKKKLANKKKYDALFPDPFMNKKQINYGGFLLYLAGIMYMFQGISLVTQNYINPAIDTIKKKGILGSDTMNATLLAFSNSAAESFIVVNSIFMGVPDIGIQTAVQ